MYEFPGEGRKAGVHMPPWNPLEGRPCKYNTLYLGILNSQMIFYRDVEIEPYLQASLLKLRCN